MNVYYKETTTPASFSGINKISSHARKSTKYVSKKLNELDAYTLHKPARKRFERSKVVVGGVNNQFDSDLFDVTAYKKWNAGYSYILIVIDVFSRYLMTEPLKSKRSSEVAKALSKVLRRRSCINFRSDAGGEFNNKIVSKLLSSKLIKHIIARNTETKANYAEMVIRTLSKKMFRYFTENNTYKWKNVLENLVTSYKNTLYRTIGKAPSDVTKENEADVFRRLYLNDLKPARPYSLEIGAVVRMSVLKGNFKKDRDENWTRELFIVISRYRRSGLPLYKVKDWSGDLLVGSFYEEELQSIRVDAATEYKIDRVIRSRVKNGKKQLLVHWLGWPTKFDSWIDARSVK